MGLVLTATAEPSSFALGSSVVLRVTLTNQSQSNLWVNRRFGAGYGDGFERELYFTLFDSAGKPMPIADDARTDAHRLPPRREDFVCLHPGAGVSAEVDLAMWHPLPGPGTYRVVVHYQNECAGDAFGIHAFTGTLQASPITFEIR